MADEQHFPRAGPRLKQAFRHTYITTPRGSRIAVYEQGPRSGPCVLVVGGYSARSISQGPLAEAITLACSAAGVRLVMVDNAACGLSRHYGELTMDTWLDDLQFVSDVLQAGGGLCVGASIGAWLMLLLHQRGRLPFRSLCALAPAIDWGEQYIHPGLRERRFVDEGAFITTDGQPLVPKSLLASMERFVTLDAAYEAAAPIHIIHGELDELAPIHASRGFVGASTGAACELEPIAGEGHGVSKLSSVPAKAAFDRWFATQLSAGHA